MRNIMIFAIIGMLLFGCINPPQGGNNTTSAQPVMTSPNATLPANATANASNATVTPPANQTGQNQGRPALPANYTVDLGDQVSVMYALYIDGALFDTNNATLANESGIYSPNRNYAPLNFTAQIGSGMIDGFVVGVVGMMVNQTLAFSVDPERGYGPYDAGKVVVVPRYYNKTMSEVVPRSYFTEQGLNFTNGTTFDTPYGYVFVQDFNEDNVTIFYSSLATVGYEFTYNGIPNKVVSSLVENVTIERMFDVNRSYVVPDPRTGQPARYLVVDKTDQNITLDGNHALSNKTLNFVVTLLDATPYSQD